MRDHSTQVLRCSPQPPHQAACSRGRRLPAWSLFHFFQQNRSSRLRVFVSPFFFFETEPLFTLTKNNKLPNPVEAPLLVPARTKTKHAHKTQEQYNLAERHFFEAQPLFSTRNENNKLPTNKLCLPTLHITSPLRLCRSCHMRFDAGKPHADRC